MNGSESPQLISFVEAPAFSEQLAELAGARQMELLYAIQDELLADPGRGDLIKGLGGVRKARIAAPDKPEGKRGGYRYLYLYLEVRGRIHLLYLFSKREQADLTNEQRKRVAAVVELIKQEERP
jgi:hypothetical protein